MCTQLTLTNNLSTTKFLKISGIYNFYSLELIPPTDELLQIMEIKLNIKSKIEYKNNCIDSYSEFKGYMTLSAPLRTHPNFFILEFKYYSVTKRKTFCKKYNCTRIQKENENHNNLYIRSVRLPDLKVKNLQITFCKKDLVIIKMIHNDNSWTEFYTKGDDDFIETTTNTEKSGTLFLKIKMPVDQVWNEKKNALLYYVGFHSIPFRYCYQSFSHGFVGDRLLYFSFNTETERSYFKNMTSSLFISELNEIKINDFFFNDIYNRNWYLFHHFLM